MTYYTLLFNDLGVEARISTFTPTGGDGESHVIFTYVGDDIDFDSQANAIDNALKSLRNDRLDASFAPVFKRYFLSDSANQYNSLPLSDECAVSIVEQPPLNGTKVALWVYFQQNVNVKRLDCNLYEVTHGNNTHYWLGSSTAPGIHSEVATRLLLGDYDINLNNLGCSLKDNCVRTWFFVQNVDVNYAGVVKGRNDVFVQKGLTRDTHFIASTGIGGRHPNHHITVEMDAYAVKNLAEGQMSYLYALDHLNPTYEYGVAFERGTCVDYGDRRQVFISGTASINNKGEVVHPGNIKLQTRRMWENVEALLNEGGCDWYDVGHMIVYLRDVADYKVVNEMFEERFPDMPVVIVLAPVCRPGWLIEMECMAVKQQSDKCFADF